MSNIKYFDLDTLITEAKEDNLDSIKKLGEFYMYLGKYDKMEECWEKLAKVGDLDIINKLVNHFLKEQEYPKVIKYALYGKKLDDTISIYNLGIGFCKTNQYDLMFEHLEIAIERGLDHAMNFIGHYYFENDDYSNALKYYSMGIPLESAPCYNSLGCLYQKIGNNDELVVEYYNKAIEKGYIRSMINLANFYESKNDYKNMEKTLQLAIEHKDIEAIHKLSNYYFQINDEENKIKYIKIGADLDDYKSLYLLADYHRKSYNYDEAIKVLEHMYSLGHAYGLTGIGQIYQARIKDYEKMKYYYEEAIKLEEPTAMQFYGSYFKMIMDYDNMFKYYSMFNNCTKEVSMIYDIVVSASKITDENLEQIKLNAEDNLGSNIMLGLYYFSLKQGKLSNMYFQKSRNILKKYENKYLLAVQLITKYFINMNKFLKDNNINPINTNDNNLESVETSCCSTTLDYDIIFCDECPVCKKKFLKIEPFIHEKVKK